MDEKRCVKSSFHGTVKLMKRLLLIVFLLICLITPVLGDEFVFHSLEAYPTQLYMIWSAVEGAEYYDIYLDRAPLKRVQGGTMAFIGDEENPLESQRSYEVLIIARQTGDIDLAYLSERITTAERYSQEFALLAAHPWPNQFDLFWTMVEGAKYYDLYLDRVPIKRVWQSHGTTIGSNEQPLVSNQTYEILVIERKEGDV